VSGLVVTGISPGMGRRLSQQALEWLPALVVFAVAVGLWQGLIAAFHVQQFLLPKPSDIVRNCWEQRSTLWPAGWYTFKEALGGFAIGSVAGMAAATLIGRFRLLGSALMPIAIAANAVPIIAFAPIFNQWFNPLSPSSKMAMAAVLCFLPVMVNTLRGLQSANPHQIELMRSYAASGFTIWRRVRVPTALPFVFTALKIASVLAMIGAIVGEYFGGSYDALGVLIRSKAQILDFETAWAGILVASVLGIALYLGVVAAERLVVRWTPEISDS
jgi:NitT/TauT family transport system permease protein